MPDDIEDILEQRIHIIGREILNRAVDYVPGFFSVDGMKNSAFDLFMRNQRTKTQVFRFAEVMPVLDDEEIIEHLKEYVIDEYLDEHLDFGTLGILVRPALKKAVDDPDWGIGKIKKAAGMMAASFIPGENVSGAIDVLEEKYGRDRVYTFDILGEITTSEEDARRYVQKYEEELDRLIERYGKNAKDHTGKPLVNISIKLSGADEHFDPIDPEGVSERLRRRLRRLFKKAKDAGAFINLDAEHHQYRDLTNQIFKDLLMEDGFRDYEYFGTVVQANLRDSEKVLDDLIAFSEERKTPFTVRLVKGAYLDHEAKVADLNGWEFPGFKKKRFSVESTDANYERLTRNIFENIRRIRGAFATHNVRSIANVLAIAEELDVDTYLWELQKLYGVADEVGRALEEIKVKINGSERKIGIRDYVPVGKLIPGMGYFVRRLLENSSNEAFVRGLNKNPNIEDILRNPALPSESLEGTLEEGILRDEQPAWKRYFAPVIYTAKYTAKLINGLYRWFFHRKETKQLEGDKQNCKEEGEFKNFPTANFALEGMRIRAREADERLEQRIKATTIYAPLYINGKIVNTNEFIESRIPFRHDQVLGLAFKGKKEHVDAQIKTAKSNVDNWKNTPISERAEYLEKAANLIEDDIDDLAALARFECGKNWRESYADAAEAIDFLRYYASEIKKYEGNIVTQNRLGERNVMKYEGKGVVSVISPWNFPVAINVGMVAAALVAGNTVVTKPSPDTPLTGSRVVEYFRKAGLPEGVLNFIVCDNEDARWLVESPDVDMIAFTGSEKVGLYIKQEAAKVTPGQMHMKTAVVEMGGKNAIIVDSDADLEQAVLGVINSAFSYNGQKCSACSRVIVHKKVYDAFTSKLINTTRCLRVGEPLNHGIDIGAVINERAYDTILGFIEQSVKEGGRVLYGGAEHEYTSNENGFYICPTLIEVDEGNILNFEEVFGPVLAIRKAEDYEHAIRIANETRFGSTVGIYTRMPSHIAKAQRELAIGNVYVNKGITGAIVQRQPFVGFKMSGDGIAAGGPDYLRQFMNMKVVSENNDRSGHVEGIERFFSE